MPEGKYTITISAKVDSSAVAQEIKKIESTKATININNISIDEGALTRTIQNALKGVKWNLDSSNLASEGEKAGRQFASGLSRGMNSDQIINDLKRRLSATYKSAKTTGNEEYSKIYDSINRQINAFSRNIDNLGKAAQNERISTITNRIKDLSNVLSTDKNLNRLDKEVVKIGESSNDASKAISNLKKQLASMNAELAGKNNTELSSRYDKLRESVEALERSLSSKTGLQRRNYTPKIDNLKLTADELSNDIAAAKKSGVLDQSTVQYSKEVEIAIDSLIKKYKELQQAANKIGQTQMAAGFQNQIAEIERFGQELQKNEILTTDYANKIKLFESEFKTAQAALKLAPDESLVQYTTEVETAVRSIINSYRDLEENARSIGQTSMADGFRAARESLEQYNIELQKGETQNASYMERMESEAQKVKLALQELKGAQDVSVLGGDPVKYESMAGKVDTFRASIQKMLDTWSRAKGTAPYQELERVSAAADQLKANLANTNADTAARSLAELQTSARQAGDALEQTGMRASTVGSKIKSAISGYLGLFTGTMAVMRVVQYTKQAVRATIELDTAMTQLQIVTKKTDAEMANYADSIVDVANQTASSVKDMVDMTTTFSRLGYGIEDATELGRITGMLTNVGAIDASAATDSMTAILKAFGMMPDEMEAVMDKMVKVGNNAPISVSQLAEGMNNASAILATATEGNFDQSVAMLTAANTTIQNISKSSTALRTIVARIRKVDTELDELGEVMTSAEYDKLTQAITDQNVALTDENGELRNTYDVLRDLSVAWQDMTANEKASLAQMFGSTRNQNVFTGLMENFDEASKAMNLMESAEGELAESNAIYLESIQAHVQSLKNTFETLFFTDSMTGFITDIVDVGQSILKVIQSIIGALEKIGGIKTVLGTVVPLLISAFSARIISSIQSFAAGLKNINMLFPSLRANVAGYTASQNAANASMSTGAKVASGLASALGLIGAALAVANLVANVVDGIVKSVQNANSVHVEVMSIDEITSEQENLDKLYDRYTELINQVSLTTDEKEELEGVTSQLLTQLGLERDAVADAKGEFDSYKESIAGALREKRDFLISEASLNLGQSKEALGNVTANMSQLAKNNSINSPFGAFGYYIPNPEDASAYFRITKDGNKDIEKQVSLLEEAGFAVKALGDEYVLMFDNVNMEDTDSILSYFDNIGNALSALETTDVSSDLYQNLKAEYQILQKWVDLYNESTSTITKLSLSEAFDEALENTKDPSNLEEFRLEVIRTASKIINENDNIVMSSEEVVMAVDDMLRLRPEFTDFYAAMDGTSVIDSTAQSLDTLKSKLTSFRQVIGDKSIVDALSIPQASIDELRSAGWDIDAVVKEHEARLASVGDEWNKLMNGNVDYNERPLLHAADMIAAGWDLAAEEMQDVFTTYTSQYDAGDFTFSITPIMEDGTVLSPEGLNEYIASLNFGGSIQDALDSDEQNLICHIALKSDLDEAGWGDLENQLGDIKARYEEVRAEGTDLRSSLIQTFSNEDDTIAMNFTPVVLDEYGNQKEILSPQALAEYANDVINGVHGDIKNIQIGATIEVDDGGARKEAMLIKQKIEDILSDLHTKYSADQFLPLIQGLTAVDNATARAKKALDELNEALKEPDYNEGLEARGSNFLAMRKLYEDQAFGSTDYAAYARYFGFVDENGRPLSPEAMGERLQAYERYAGLYQDDKGEWATDADLAMSNFLEDVDKNEGKIVRWTDELGALHTTTMDTLLSWDEDAQHFYFDPEMLFNPGKMKAVADEYGVTIENMMDLMNQIRYHSPDWIDFDETNLKSWLGDAGLMEFDEAGKAVVTYTDKIRDLLEATGMFDSSEIENIMSQVASITSTDGAIDVHLDYDSAAAAADAEGYAKTLTEAINSKISEAGGDLASNLDIAAALIAQIEDANIRQSVIDQLAGVDAELKTQLTEAVQNVDASVEMSEGDGNDDVKDSVTTVHDMVTDMDNHTFSFTLEGTNLDETKDTLEDIQKILGDIGAVSANTKTVELPNGRTFERNTGGSDGSTQNFDIKFNVDDEEAYKAISDLLQYLNEQFESNGILTIRAEDDESRGEAEALVSFIKSQNPEMNISGDFDSVKSGADRTVTYIEDQSPEMEASLDTEEAKLAAGKLIEDIESQTVTLQVAFESAPEEAAAAISDPNQQANQYFDVFPTNETYSGPFDIDPQLVNGNEITDAITDSIQNADTDVEVDVDIEGMETDVQGQLDGLSEAADSTSAAFSNAADSVSDLNNQKVNLSDQEAEVHRMHRAAKDSTESQNEMAGSLQKVSNTNVNASNKTQPINQVSSSAQKATGMVTGLASSIQRMSSVQVNAGGTTSVFQQVASFAQRASSAIQDAIQSLIRWNNTPVQQKSVGVSRNAKGTRNAEPGMSLLGDEYSPSGQPKPELVVSRGEAYIAGVHGPTLGTLKRGDVVYTYDETKKILQNNLLSGSIPAFAEGWPGSGGGGLNLEKIRSGLPANASYTDNSTNTYNYNAGGDIGTAATGETQEEAEKNLQDWIEICIDRIERAISRLKKVAESTYKSLQTRISSTRNEIAKVTEEIGIQERAVARYQQEAESVGLDPSLAALVRNGTIDINEYDEATKKLIDDYAQWWEKSLNCADAIDDLRETLSALYEDQFEVLNDDFANRIELLTYKTNDYTNAVSALGTRSQQILPVMYEQLSELQGMYNSILADQNSGIDENSEAAYAMRKTLEDIAESISEKYVEIFNGINDLYQEQLNIADFYMTGVENRLAAAETKGYLISSNYYKAMGDIQKKNISTLNNELKDLEKALENALNSGRVQKYSVEWFSMNTAINDTKTAIDEANNSLLEYEKTMRELDWSHFEFLQDRISQITQEADFLIDLMSEEQLYEDNGQFTKQGQATNGLHAVNYDTYMNQADRYRQEVEKLNKELAKDPYNTDVLLHREEMLKLQRDSIAAAQKEKQAIKDLVENGIKKELEALKELIDTYKDGLNADKDQYTFEKNINEQTKNIATLEKRLSAMQGDNSEESKAQIQRLKTDLDEANQKLAETQMDHVITETQKMLDDLYLSYEEILNERLDNIDALVSDMIVMANENASLISGTITTEALNVGYHIEASLMDIWTGSGGIREVVSYYGEGFLGRLNSVNIAIDAIDAKVKDYIAHTANGGIETYAASALSVLNTISTQLGNIGAKADTSKAASSASSSTATKKSTPAPSTTTTKPAQTGGTLTNDIAMHVAAAIWNGNYGWDNWPGREAKLNEVFGPNGWNTIQPLVDRGYAFSAGYSPVGFSYADMRKKFKGYKTGGLNDYTGLAMLHGTPEKPELVLDAADTKNFIALKDVLSTNAMPSILKDIARMPKLNGIGGFGSNSNTINGGINVQVVSPQDYDDFLNQMRDDKNFEKLVQAMTTDRLVGRSSMQKNGYRW